ncbi:MAG: DUF1841 family protein [Chloroflexi bacterium]|nr:DUF1841 family protein [Chloroflexota bacterium]
MSEANPALKTAVLKAVDEQLQKNEPPETNKTYKRLRRKGYSHQEARELIAAILLAEMYDIIKYQRDHDEQKYVKNLKRLPTLPWD